MDARDWQLYTESMDCEPVGRILSESFTIMAKDTYAPLIELEKCGNATSMDDVILAAKHLQKRMQGVLTIWSKYGAYDSEPDGMLAYEVQRCHEHYFPSDYLKIVVGRWGIREEGSDEWV